MRAISPFGKKIKEIRIDNDMTINTVSKKSGVSQSYISQIENGSRDTPQPDMIKKIANGLGVDYFILMRAAGYMATSNESTTTNEVEFTNICFNVKTVYKKTDENGSEKYVRYTEEELKSNFFNLHHLITQDTNDIFYNDRVLTRIELEKVKPMLELLLGD